MSRAIGVIAEDNGDVDVIKAFLEKYVPKNEFFVRRFVGNGCGKLKSKCRAWVENLIESGCEHIFIFHDLDRNEEAVLRKGLSDKVPKDMFPTTLIVIPVEEMEAWLLSDVNALKAVFNLKTAPKKYKNCEEVSSPKEELQRLVWNIGKKRYLNTVHNTRIAEKTSLDNLRRCPSYLPFDKYLKTDVFKLTDDK